LSTAGAETSHLHSRGRHDDFDPVSLLKTVFPRAFSSMQAERLSCISEIRWNKNRNFPLNEPEIRQQDITNRGHKKSQPFVLGLASWP
jgi:hypothetical protein